MWIYKILFLLLLTNYVFTNFNKLNCFILLSSFITSTHGLYQMLLFKIYLCVYMFILYNDNLVELYKQTIEYDKTNLYFANLIESAKLTKLTESELFKDVKYLQTEMTYHTNNYTKLFIDLITSYKYLIEQIPYTNNFIMVVDAISLSLNEKKNILPNQLNQPIQPNQLNEINNMMEMLNNTTNNDIKNLQQSDILKHIDINELQQMDNMFKNLIGNIGNIENIEKINNNKKVTKKLVIKKKK